MDSSTSSKAKASLRVYCPGDSIWWSNKGWKEPFSKGCFYSLVLSNTKLPIRHFQASFRRCSSRKHGGQEFVSRPTFALGERQASCYQQDRDYVLEWLKDQPRALRKRQSNAETSGSSKTCQVFFRSYSDRGQPYEMASGMDDSNRGHER